MTTAEQEVADGLAELRALIADCKAMREELRRERRAIVDICHQFNDVPPLEAILDYLEKSCDWTRWPAESR